MHLHPVTLVAALIVLSVPSTYAANYVHACYFTNWAQYRPGVGKYTPKDYSPGLCTHILYAFGWINAQTYKVEKREWNDEVLYKGLNEMKEKDRGLKTLLSIGGATFPNNLFQTLAGNSQLRKTFINSAIEWADQYGFDGIDLDWEFPTAGDKANFAVLIKQMKVSFATHAKKSGKPQLLLTAAVTANTQTADAGYDYPKLVNEFDYIFLMAYDFHGSWEQQTGVNAPLRAKQGDPFSLEVAANHYAKRGFPKTKIVIGVGTYGRGWTLSSAANNGLGAPTAGKSAKGDFTGEAGFAAYYEICTYQKQGAKRHWDDLSKTPYLVKGNEWFTYDDVQSVNAKVDWLMKNGFAGAFTWSLDQDDFRGTCGEKYPLHNAIVKKLTGKAPPVIPTKSTPKPARTTTVRGSRSSSRRPSRSTKKPAPTKKPTGPFSCSSDGFFSDPASCESYYRCVNGVAHHFHCPNGLQFNPTAQACDWPANVNCRV
ncbi:hypothetical protein QR680_018770 [Steinernema hermaphroditum]|uniref:Chitinase n=1 Tax=Steinernema hermaphroditum TaxID=289476 RepID=A0AA39HL80_9BILA|nr:hypothetical protein QR680_018770 [Steinernema hermaphroditum]